MREPRGRESHWTWPADRRADRLFPGCASESEWRMGSGIWRVVGMVGEVLRVLGVVQMLHLEKCSKLVFVVRSFQRFGGGNGLYVNISKSYGLNYIVYRFL